MTKSQRLYLKQDWIKLTLELLGGGRDPSLTNAQDDEVSISLLDSRIRPKSPLRSVLTGSMSWIWTAWRRHPGPFLVAPCHITASIRRVFELFVLRSINAGILNGRGIDERDCPSQKACLCRWYCSNTCSITWADVLGNDVSASSTESRIQLNLPVSTA